MEIAVQHGATQSKVAWKSSNPLILLQSLQVCMVQRLAAMKCAAATSAGNGRLQYSAIQCKSSIRLHVASLRLPSRIIDDSRPAPRLQLCWASEFNSAIGLAHWTSSSKDRDALHKPRTITNPAVMRLLPMLDGCQLRGHSTGTTAPLLAISRSWAIV